MTKTYTRDKKLAFVSRIRAGETKVSIGKAAGVSISTINDWCAGIGLGDRCAPHDEEFKNRVIEAVRSGLNCNQAANNFNISRSSVRIWCKAAGVESKKPKKQHNKLKKSVFVRRTMPNLEAQSTSWRPVVGTTGKAITAGELAALRQSNPEEYRLTLSRSTFADAAGF